jgi:hypothetical protein
MRCIASSGGGKKYLCVRGAVFSHCGALACVLPINIRDEKNREGRAEEEAQRK